jgi:hypothetical protein
MAEENSISEIPRAMTKKKKSGVVIPNEPSFSQRFLAWLLWAALRLVAATLRYRIRDPHGFLQRKDISQAIYCTWHNRLALCMKMYFTFSGERRSKAGIAGLVSASRDGAFLSAILQRFGVQPVRGSTSRRGGQALLELKTWAERGYDLAITPDGPRGPRYIVQDGAMVIAQVTGLPIVPASYHLKWKIQMKSWDGFQIPLPFSICTVTAGEIFNVPRDIPDAARVELLKQLEAELRVISKD